MILPILLNRTKLLPIYVVGIGSHKSQDEIIRSCGFLESQVLYCTHGKGILQIENKEYEIRSGDAFFFRPDIPHRYYPTEEPWSTKWIVFDGSAAESILDYMGLGKSEVFALYRPDDFDVQVNTISDMFWCDDPDKEIKTSMLMYKLLIKMNECMNHTSRAGGMTRCEKYEKLNPVIELMQASYKDDLSLERMADTIGVTTNHLCRLFQQVYDTTPMKYLNHMRLNIAKQYLSTKNMLIKDVAREVGFNDPSYFCAVFKKAEGQTPEDFRRINAF